MLRVWKEHQLMNLEKNLTFTCQTCFSTFQLVEVHQPENQPCPVNCPQQWQTLLTKHYQDHIILSLAQKEAQND